MKEIDTKVAVFLNRRNQKEAERMNHGRKSFPRLAEGTKVWVLRREGSGTKLDTRWIGPAKVLEQKGANSYRLLMDGKTLDAQMKHLRLYQENFTLGQFTPLFWHRRIEIEIEAEPTEGTVEKILDHRLIDGRPQFLVRWGGKW